MLDDMMSSKDAVCPLKDIKPITYQLCNKVERIQQCMKAQVKENDCGAAARSAAAGCVCGGCVCEKVTFLITGLPDSVDLICDTVVGSVTPLRFDFLSAPFRSRQVMFNIC